MVEISKSMVFDFLEGQKPTIRGTYNNRKKLKLWNLPYLVANTYGSNFIKIRGIWIFQRAETPYWGGGGLHLICDAHFRTQMSYSSQKPCVKFGLDWMKSEVC